MTTNISIKEYEVKFFLALTKVLNSNHDLKSEILDGLSVSAPKRRYIQFIDTKDTIMFTENWILRNRKKEGDNENELTYKKRYPIINDDIESVLIQAGKDGFDTSDGNFKAEAEWGFTKKTISLSCKKELLSNNANTILPSIDELRKLFLTDIPKALMNWRGGGWGEKQINQARVFGPIQSKEYKWEWDELKISIEIWTIKNKEAESIVEVSFKAKDETTANQHRLKLKDFLITKGWLDEQDISKTQWAMERCK